MDPGTFQLIYLIAASGSQLVPLLLQIDTSKLTPDQKVQWEGLISRIKTAQDMVTPYIKEPEVK